MSISNQVANNLNDNLENTVYFYPNKLKISYTSLENLKSYLAKIFSQDIRLEEKLRRCNFFLNLILKELINKGILQEDHTMVITDPVVDKTNFLEALEPAYSKTLQTKISITKPSQIKIAKRQLLTAFFIKKENNFKDFINILRGKGEAYSSILRAKIDLEKHSQIKFRASKELETYIVNILTRAALLSQGCSVFTLRMYIEIIIELVIWYSRSIAILENSTEVGPNILSASIKLVDNHYITDPNFIKMLQGKLIGNIIKFLN